MWLSERLRLEHIFWGGETGHGYSLFGVMADVAAEYRVFGRGGQGERLYSFVRRFICSILPQFFTAAGRNYAKQGDNETRRPAFISSFFV